MANPPVGGRGQPVTAGNGRPLGFIWRGDGSQGWCAEYADPNGTDTDTLIGVASAAEAARWLADKQGSALPNDGKPASN